MTNIICPVCRHQGEVTTSEQSPSQVMQAPYRCPNCLGLYFVHIENGALLSCEPLTESGYARWKLAQDQS